ncbi:MAG: hypothetical protein ACJ72X_04095 [Nitrososphaeraceae archaeon]|jgi:hypothetical protein
MCSLDYESILNPQKKEENKKYLLHEHRQEEFTKAMEGPGGYFLEPGGYIVDKRNTENQRSILTISCAASRADTNKIISRDSKKEKPIVFL